MNDRTEVQRSIRKRFKNFGQTYGFWFHKPTVLMRMDDSVLSIVNFDIHKHGGLNCDVAIQPLYVPIDGIALNCGNRLNYFDVILSGNWGYGDPASLEQELIEIEGLIIQNVLPWFDEAGNPEGLIAFLRDGDGSNKKPMVRMDPFWRRVYLGFSCLYIGSIEEGVAALERAIQFLPESDAPWVNTLNQNLRNLIMLSHRGGDEAKRKLDEFVEYTKTQIGIKPPHAKTKARQSR